MKWALRTAFWIGLVLATAGPLTLILSGYSEAGWAAMISGLILMLGSRFELIEELSLGPLRAKLRQRIEETDTTLVAIRNLAALVASISLSLVKRSGRIGGYTDEEEEQIAKEVKGFLEQIDIDEANIDETFAEWHNAVGRDYVHFILGGNTIPDGGSPELFSEWEALRSRWFDNLPAPEELTGFLSKGGALTPEREEWIEDYRFYLERHGHRRPEVWEQRRDLAERLTIQEAQSG